MPVNLLPGVFKNLVRDYCGTHAIYHELLLLRQRLVSLIYSLGGIILLETCLVVGSLASK